MVSWSTIQSVLLFFGPLLLPRLLAWYKSVRARPASAIKTLPPKTGYALAILFTSAVIFFLSTLPLFGPSNIFTQTHSRLQTPAGVLMTRLAALRPLTPFDERLREVLNKGGLDARLLYAQYGPHVLADNPFSSPGDADASRTYFFYALPSLLAPHLLHLLALGIATSSVLSGREGARWRTLATIAGVMLAAAEVWYVANYDDRPNLRSTRVGEIDFVYWKMNVWRGLAIAALDAGLGWMVWLAATGRAFVAPLETSERIADHAQALEGVLQRTRGLGVVKNGGVRDAGTRRAVENYWVKEGEVMRDVFEDADVVAAQRNALKRVDTVRVGREAEAYVDSIFLGLNAAGLKAQRG